ncbi:ESPR-type extended signal peptide-containing protein, partial [Testudinibacter aquarius]
MNKIYKVIWSKVVQAWVVVSELGSSQSKGGSVRTLVRASNHSLLSPLSAVAFAVSMAFAGLAQAVVVSTTGYTNGSPNASIVIGSAVGNTGCWGGTGTASGVDYSAVSAVDGSGQLASVWGCANGNGQVAATLLGSGAKANGAWATAMGPYAEAGTRGSAFGVKANAGGNDAVALGSFANATASQTVAIGGSIGNAADATNRANATTASAVGAVAIGSNTVRGAQASGTDSIAIGGQSTASGGGTIAIGNLATGTVANTVAIGVSTNATGFDSVALGSGAQALAGGANIAIGRGAYTNGTSSPANPANGTNISIGSAAGVGQTTTANGNVAIGGNAGQNVSGRANLAMGFQAGSGVSGNANIAFGRSAGFGGTAAAPYAQSGSVAIGDSALSSSATGYSTAVGSYAQATGQQAIAIGGGSAANSIASGNNAVAIGTVGTQATSSNTVALGSSAQANAISAIAVGNSAHALGQGSVVMGSAAGQLNTQAYTIAIGNSAGTATTGTTNTENTAIGRSAGQNVSGNTNLALSSQAGQNVSGSNNFAAMLQAGQYVSGNNNIAIGQTAGRGSAATAMAASHTVALSTGAVASQDNAIAIGRTSQATNANAVAMGYTARALGANSIAMGNAALVNSSAGNAIAIGINALSTTYSGVAIGDNARATTSGLTSATAGSSTAIGRNAGANLGTAVGEGAWAASSSVSIGRNAASVPKDWSTSDMNTTNNNFGISNYPGAGNVVIGDNARAMVGGRGANLASVALGYGASIVATDETTITNQRLLGVGSATALGGNTLITGSTGATVVGANANSTGSNGSVSVGQYATAGTLARGILTPAEAGIAIGGARYNTNGAVVASTATRVTGEAAIAIGSALPTGTTYQITTATAANAIALGTGAQALAENTISIGTGNVVRGANSGALGDPSYISGSGTYTIGNDNGTSAQPIAANNSGAFGNNNAMIVGGSSGIRIVGNNNNVSSSNVMVLGNNVIVGTGLDGAVVLGNDSTVSKAVDTAKTDLNGLTYTYATAGAAPADGDVVSVGTAAKPRQIQNVANGQVSATSLDAINGSQLYAVADTLSGKLTHFYSVANTDSTAGNYNNDGATGANAMALGPNAKAVGAQSIAMGLNAQTSDGADSVAIGHESNASTGSVAMGRGTVANGQNAVAIGLGAQATSAESDNFGGVAIGGQSRATTPTGALYTATAIGYSSQATTDGALALGDTAKATANAGDVALGSNSATAAVVNTTEAGIGGLKYSGFAGTAATSTVSVGDTDKERTLTNVAAGRISQTSTDAINGSQLYATNLTLSNVATTAVSILGGDAKLATDGNITMTNIGDTGKTTVHDAIKAAKTEVTNGTNVTSVVKTEGANGQAVYTVNANGTTASAGSTAVTVSADPKDGTTNITNYKVDLSQETKDSIAKADSALQSWTAQVNGTTAKTIDKDNTTLNFVNGDNILITNDNGGIKVSTSMTPTFTSVNATTITAPTISTGNGGPSMTTTGIDAGSQKITNVTAGSADTDAVNYSQLKAVQDAAKTSSVVKGTNVASVTSTTTGVNTEYTVNADGTTVSGTGAVKVTAGDKNATTNVTDYALDLTDKTKEDIAKGVTASEDIASKGIAFAGDSGDNATRKLGETLNVKGGNTTEANLTDNNIGVVSNGADTLTVKLAKDINLGATGSLTINNNKLDKDGLEVVSGVTSVSVKPIKLGDPVSVVATDGSNTAVYGAKGLSFTETNGTPLANSPSISQTGINAGSQQITAVKSGVDGTTLADAAGDTLTNAANIGDVKNAITNLETQYQGDNTTVTVKRKPAEVLSITGGATDLTDNNIGTVGNADGSIAVKLAKNLTGLTDVATESLSVGDKVTITSAGIDAGGLPITNVADGVNDDDAVNMSQLNKVAGGWEIGNDITEDKIGNVAAGKRVDFVSGNEESTQVTVAQGADGNSVVTVEAAPGALRYSNTNTAAGGNVSTGDQFTATDSVTLVGKDGDTSGGVTINNVAPGTLSADSKQAV